MAEEVASSQSLVFPFIRRGSQFPNTGSWPTRVRNGEGFGDPLAEETSDPQAKYIFVISAKRSIRVRALRTTAGFQLAPFFTGLSMSRKGQCERSVCDER